MKSSQRKRLVQPLKLVKIKNSFGFLQSNPQVLAEWVEPIFLIKKCLRGTALKTLPEAQRTQGIESIT